MTMTTVHRNIWRIDDISIEIYMGISYDDKKITKERI
ncbi:hypothetical protein NTHI1209_01204 [Haemophilus influenzae]|uniref:Uncharacterized protein n=1 Tax=Haemophilus influenzae TaxID=727 RepID=A0A158SXK3_HAEIF|nr:hypothetical protein NTHI1209_01204 [Haemophilus influenzae]